MLVTVFSLSVLASRADADEAAANAERARLFRRLDGIDARLSLGQVYGELATGYSLEFQGLWRFYRDRDARWTWLVAPVVGIGMIDMAGDSDSRAVNSIGLGVGFSARVLDEPGPASRIILGVSSSLLYGDHTGGRVTAFLEWQHVAGLSASQQFTGYGGGQRETIVAASINLIPIAVLRSALSGGGGG